MNRKFRYLGQHDREEIERLHSRGESRKRKSRGIYETVHKDQKKKIILNNDKDDRRRLFETCVLKMKKVCSPIIDWTDADMWDYIRSEHLARNPLYQCDFSRVGCFGCPIAGKPGSRIL